MPSPTRRSDRGCANQREQVLPTGCADRSRHGRDFRARLLGWRQSSTRGTPIARPMILGQAHCLWANSASRSESGRTITQADLDDRVLGGRVHFHPMSAVMPSHHERDENACRSALRPTNALLVSISVDPEHDTAGRFEGLRGPIWSVARSLVVSDGAQGGNVRPGSQWFQARARRIDGRRSRRRVPNRSLTAIASRWSTMAGSSGFFESTDPTALDELVERANPARPAAVGPRLADC